VYGRFLGKLRYMVTENVSCSNDILNLKVKNSLFFAALLFVVFVFGVVIVLCYIAY
jgi:hypothetical protein